MKTLVIASANEGKVAEFRNALANLLGDKVPKIISAGEAGITAFPPEDGKTYEENALVKARFVAAQTSLPSLGDDSGLEVYALNGAPGLYSARYGGDLNNNERIAHLLKQLEGVPQKERGARFVCALALVSPDGDTQTFWGECKGEILEAPMGTDGFGYDPIFYSYDLKHSFAQTSSENKAHVSHRGRALHKLTEWLDQTSLPLFSGGK